MKNLPGMCADFFTDERGGVAVEYGLIASLIVMVLIGSMRVFYGSLGGKVDSVADKIDKAGTSS